MKKLPYLLMPLLIALVWLGACTSQAEQTISELDALLGELKLEYAPDERVELWKMSAAEVEGAVVLKGEVASKEAYKAVVKGVDELFPEVKNELVLLPEGEMGAEVNGLVNNSVIHLRREPSSKKELVTQALLGTPVRILKEEAGKSLIQVADGYLGWVNTAEVHALDQEGLAAYKEAEKVVYTAQYGLTYSTPDESSMPVTDLVIGNLLTRVSEGPEFSQVKYPDGRLGWVKSSEVVPAGEVFYKTTLKENLVQTAMKYHGIPYLWGGTSSKNIDCSGLISNVYFMNGIQLPRDADMQALIGRELGTEFIAEGLEPGDLLFFGRKAAGGKEESVTHVAMYIGGGEYIHSAGYRERVSINSMDSTQDNFIERYPAIFVRAVRILGEDADGFRPIAENKYYKEIIRTSE
ncbi:MAG: C40 family peptidase [Bacteroidales bacterium]|nr:C40 family peptidase [Bacteroidales bacterium]